MGQTLTHGIYLPDEGERNCYSGLAANWQILDNSVGTIAAHTAALAGKAPLVHTHTKADITDLFNSANTWSGDNTFSKAVGFTKVNATTLYAQNARVELGDSGLSGDSYNQISFWDKNGDNVSYLRQTYNTDGTNTLNIFIRNKFLNGVPNTAGTVDYAYFGIILGADKSKQAVFKANLRPYDSTYAYSLGDSTYKWKTLNGVNPGALSIFNPSATQDPIDVPNTWATDGSAWNTLNVSNMGDGWICLTYRLCGANDYILARFGGASANIYPSMIFPATLLQDSKYYIYTLMPVTKAMGNIYLEIKLDSNAVLVKHSFIPAYGTV